MGPEAHHLIHVMRARIGDEVELFDGSGAEFVATVERLGRAEVELAISSRAEVDRESPRPCTLAVALPKGDRQQWLVEKAVELGIARLVPIVTARGVAQPTDNALARLRRAVVEATKQCGRTRLMAIDAPSTWPALLAESSTSQRRLIAHPGGVSLRTALPAEGPLLVAIGPEGGFTDQEVQQALAAGWQQASLGPRILRIETAAIFVAAVVSAQA